jgi:hypothetical protein
MRKSTFYLDDGEAESLRRVASALGKSQAEIIREGVRRILAKNAKRSFRSLGLGKGTGKARPRWRSEDLYKKTLGRS